MVDGPFTEAKEPIAGYWLIQVKSMEEAIEWVKRCPNPLDGETEIETRQVFEAEDFGDELTPELREQEDRTSSRRPRTASCPALEGRADPRAESEVGHTPRFG